MQNTKFKTSKKAFNRVADACRQQFTRKLCRVPLAVGWTGVLLLLLSGSFTLGQAQGISDPNQIVGTIRWNNPPGPVLNFLNSVSPAHGLGAPGTVLANQVGGGFSANTVIADDLSHINAPYSITVQSGIAPGIQYDVKALMYLEDSGYYWFGPATSAGVQPEPAPDVQLDLPECAGLIEVSFCDPQNNPVTVNNGLLDAYFPPNYNIAPQAHGVIATPVTSKRLVVRGGETITLVVQIKQTVGTDPFFDQIILTYTSSYTVTVGCDQLVSLKFIVPPSPLGSGAGIVGKIIGNVDMLTENEHWIYHKSTQMTADQGPQNNSRYADVGLLTQPGHLPCAGSSPFVGTLTCNSAGPFSLPNLLPSDFLPNQNIPSGPRPYRVYGFLTFGNGPRFQQFVTPALDGFSIHNPKVTVPDGGTIDLGDTFVICPGYVRGDILLCGPPTNSSLAYIYSDYQEDTDGDGIPNKVPLGDFTWVQALGVNALGAGATMTAYGGGARGLFPGTFVTSSGADQYHWKGDYRLTLGGLGGPAGQTTLWDQRYLTLLFLNSVTFVPDTYYYSIVGIANNHFANQVIVPKTTVTNDHHYGFSDVTITFHTTSGTLFDPVVSGQGSFNGLNFEGQAADYIVQLLYAHGTPLNINTAASDGQVNASLPEGTYTFNASVESVNPGGTTSSHNTLLPFTVVVPPCTKITVDPDIQMTVANLPMCATNRLLHVSGSINSTTNVATIYYQLNGGAAVVVCNNCGVSPSFSFNITLADCLNILKITAIDANGHVASVQSTTTYDLTPPVLTGCPTAPIPLPCNSTPTCATVAGLLITASDVCDGPITPICTAGPVVSSGGQNSQTFTLTATDVCRNHATCLVTYTWPLDCCTNAQNFVVNGSFEQTSPAVTTFRQDLLPLTGVPGWDTFTTPATSSPRIEIWTGINSMAASLGTNHLEMNNLSVDQTVFQVVTNLTPGCPTTLCFDYAGRPGYADNTFIVSVSGGASISATFNPDQYHLPVPAGGWHTFCTNFIPTASSVTIGFRGKPTPPIDGGAHIDNVSLTQCCPTNPCLTVICASNKIVECDSVWAFDPPTAYDACCGTNVTITPLTVSASGDACSNINTMVWRATDCYSNSITCTQTVTVVDGRAPVITNCPASTNLGCNPVSIPGYSAYVRAADECGVANLLVASRLSDEVKRYGAQAGNYLGNFTSGNGLIAPRDMVLGPDGKLYVSSGESSDEVKRYDPVTGAFLGTFVPTGSGGLDEPIGLAFGPDGNLYVSSLLTDQVKRYHGITGAYLGNFASGSGLLGPRDVVFGPDGHLYVCSFDNDQVLRFNGVTGVFLDTFVATGAGGLNGPYGLEFGPDGHLYVTSQFTHQVKRYHGSTGAYLGDFASGGGLNGPRGLRFGPDGKLYVSSGDNDTVKRYNGTTGAFIDTFASGGGLDVPTFLIFQPTAQLVWSKTDSTNGCSRTRTNTYTATDACGHTNICTQVITWTEDTTPPEMFCTDFGILCGTPLPLNPPVALDACSGTNVTFTLLSTTTNGLCPKFVERAWQATDPCGNSSVCTQHISVVDFTPPVFTTQCTTNHFEAGTTNDNFNGPEPTSPSPGLVARLRSLGAVFKGFDDCTTEHFVAHTFTNLPPCITRATLTVRLKTCGTILCGNDTFGFGFTGPNGQLVPGSGSWSKTLGSLVSDDWCNHTSGNTFVFDLSALPTGGGDTDLIASMNQTGFLDVICQDDSAMDYITLDVVSCCCGTNRTVECGTAWTFETPTAYDNCCGTNITLTVLSTVTSGICPQQITRTWQATDCCSNSATCVQIITVVDTTPPIITCATNRVLECGPPFITERPTAWDACSGTNMTITLFTAATTGSFCKQTNIMVWQATDRCDNTSFCTQTVAIVDTLAPTLTCAANKTVECGSNWNFDLPTAYDACCGTNLALVAVSTVSTGSCPQYVTRTWQATDCCDNSTTCSQTVTVLDTTPPMITCGNDVGVFCGTAWSFATPVASDICCGTNVTITALSTITNGTCPQLITRTWLATDCCGNTKTCSQTVTSVDFAPPILTCASNKVVECGSSWTFDPPDAVDDCCGTNVTITVLSTVTNGTGCPFLVTRTWQATDCCSNSVTCAQTVAVMEFRASACGVGTNLICNGSFESPPILANNLDLDLDGLTGVPCWTATPSGNDIELWNGSYGAMMPSDLNQHLEISAGDPNEIVSQVVNGLSTNCPATICFDYAGRPGGFNNNFAVEIRRASGAVLLTQSLNPASYTATPGGWYHYSATFTPPSSTIKVSFISLIGNGDPGGAHIDYVALTQNCCPPNQTLHGALIGGNIVLSWSGTSYHLQGTASLTPVIVWSNIAGPSPVTLPASGPLRFFRLVCP